LRTKNLFDEYGNKKNYLMPFSIDEDNALRPVANPPELAEHTNSFPCF
jgi:hypothetical protein